MNCFNSDLVHGGSNTVFDLNALNDALTKPRNKVAPAAVSLLSVNHLKSTAGIFWSNRSNSFSAKKTVELNDLSNDFQFRGLEEPLPKT